MDTYDILNIAVWCEDKREIDDTFDFCYEYVRENFFDEIGGGDFLEESYDDDYDFFDYINEAATPSSSLAKAKALVKKNKKKIAIIAACATALIAVVLILNKKGDKKKAEAAKKAGEALKEAAKKAGEENKKVENTIKTVEKEAKAASTPEAKKTVENKVAIVVAHAEKVAEKTEKIAEKAEEQKKFYAPAVVTVNDKELDKRHQKVTQLDFELNFSQDNMGKYAYELEKYYGKDFQKRVMKKLYKLTNDSRAKNDPEFLGRALEHYANQLGKDPKLKGGPFSNQSMAYNWFTTALGSMGKSIRRNKDAYRDASSGRLWYDTAVNARNKAERKKVYGK